jgi:Tfp pilus assembly protein PilV
MRVKVKKTEKGQSLFEIIFVIAIVALVLVGIVSLSATTVRNTDTSSNQVLAARHTRETVDWLRNERDIDWGSVSDRAGVHTGAGNTYCINAVGSWPGSAGECAAIDFISGTNLQREVVLRYTNALENEVSVTIEVSWTDSQGLHQEIINTTLVDWNQVEYLH